MVHYSCCGNYYVHSSMPPRGEPAAADNFPSGPRQLKAWYVFREGGIRRRYITIVARLFAVRKLRDFFGADVPVVVYSQIASLAGLQNSSRE